MTIINSTVTRMANTRTPATTPTVELSSFVEAIVLPWTSSEPFIELFVYIDTPLVALTNTVYSSSGESPVEIQYSSVIVF